MYCLIIYDLFVSLQIFKIYVMYKNYIYNLQKICNILKKYIYNATIMLNFFFTYFFFVIIMTKRKEKLKVEKIIKCLYKSLNLFFKIYF